MFDFALLAKGGADKADRSTAVALDFEVERKRFAFNGHKISIIDSTNQVNTDYCMATNEMKNGCGLSTEALLAGNLKRRCDLGFTRSVIIVVETSKQIDRSSGPGEGGHGCKQESVLMPLIRIN